MTPGSLQHRLERIGLVIGLLLAAVIVILVLIRVVNSDQGPLEPTPNPTSAPTSAPTAIATPATPTAIVVSEPTPEPGSLLHMLGYAPDRLQDNSLPLSDIARYANLDAWMTARGVAQPTGLDDPGWEAWHTELATLALPEVLATRGTEPIWLQTYGFGLQQIYQVLAVGSAPDYVMVLRGDFDADTLATAWAESGYQAVRVDGVTYWSLYPGGSVDLSAPASRPALGNMNNLVLLEDGTLIATARSDRMEQTIRAVRGGGPTLATNEAITTLLAPGVEPQSLISAVLLKGSVLEELAIASPSADIATPVAALPEASMMLAGIRLDPATGQVPTMVIVAVYDSADDATAAHLRTTRWLESGTSAVTGAPYTDRVLPISQRVIAAGNQRLLMLHLGLGTDVTDWLQIIEQRDLGYLMWPQVP